MNESVEKILLEFDPEGKNLLGALKKISASFGYVSISDSEKIASYFKLPLSRVYETATFYDQIKVEKRPDLLIQVCSGGSCALGGSFSLVKEIEKIFQIKEGKSSNPRVQLEVVSCLERCGRGPVVLINGKEYFEVDGKKLHEIIKEYV